MTLPFLTLPDPKISGEGALDPLGVATISDRLAEQILPGLRARMARPRFLTAMAACAAVCDGIEDEVAADGTTPAYVVFEWLLVEGFARAADRQETIRTPGMLKAQAARDAGEPMRASAYLRIPTIFGFHGIYRPLARQSGVVDSDMRLGEAGYALLKEWQAEQGLPGFLPTATGAGAGNDVRNMLRSALDDALKQGCTTRSNQWRGWSVLANHLSPAGMGAKEATAIHRLLVDQTAGTRGEVFSLIESNPPADEMTELEVATHVLLPASSAELRRQLEAVVAFEACCALLEDAFDWIRYLSSQAGARAISANDFASSSSTRAIALALPPALFKAENAIAQLAASFATQQELAELARAFDHIKTAEGLFNTVLERHHEVQQAKTPDGKRDWFERSPDGATFVRVPYRTKSPPAPRNWWGRPYRVDTVRSFLNDLKVSAYAPT